MLRSRRKVDSEARLGPVPLEFDCEGFEEVGASKERQTVQAAGWSDANRRAKGPVAPAKDPFYRPCLYLASEADNARSCEQGGEVNSAFAQGIPINDR